MMRTILVPLDGSTWAEGALDIAGALARSAGATLALVQAVPAAADGTILSADLDAARWYLYAVAERLRGGGLAVSASVRCRAAADAVTREAHRRHADLIVMATHGRGSVMHHLLGSVAESIIASVVVPVVLVRPRGDAGVVPPIRLTKILVPLDGSPQAEQALDFILAHHLDRDAQVLVLRAVAPVATAAVSALPAFLAHRLDEARMEDEQLLVEAEAYLQGVVQARSHGQQIESLAVVGYPAKAILETGEREQVDLIAMIAHADERHAAIRHGVAAELIRHTHIPLLLIRCAPDATSASAARPMGCLPAVDATASPADGDD